MPKQDLVTAMQLLLQGRRVRVAPALADAPLLARELTTFGARDLVLAVATAAWQAERPGPGFFIEVFSYPAPAVPSWRRAWW